MNQYKICVNCNRPEEEHHALMFCEPYVEGRESRRYQPPKGAGSEILGNTTLVTLHTKEQGVVKGVTRNLEGTSVDIHVLPGDTEKEVEQHIYLDQITEITVHG